MTWVTPEDHGAAGNGSANDHGAIEAALIDAKTNGKGVRFGAGKTYLVQSKIAPSITRGWDHFVWEGNNATIKIDSSVDGSDGDPFLCFRDCKNMVIHSVIIDGNAANRNGGKRPETFGGHNIQITGCIDFLFHRCVSKNAGTDGWRVSASVSSDSTTNSRNGRWVECVADANGRNGISFIEATDMLVLRGQYRNHQFRQPMSGIDVEPNDQSSAQACRHITVMGAEFFGNFNGGLHMARAGQNDGVNICGCRFWDNGGRDGLSSGGSQSHAAGIQIQAKNVLIQGCEFFDHLVGNDRTHGVIFMPVNPAIVGVTIIDNEFRNNIPSGGWSGGGAAQVRLRGKDTDRKVVFCNNRIEASGSNRVAVRIETDNNLIERNIIIAGRRGGWHLPGSGNMMNANIPAS